MSETEALSGRLDDVGQIFDNETGFRRTARPSDLPADPERLAYFRRYLADYFNDAFVPGMGAEAILAVLAEHGGPGGRVGRWLDLGAGTSTLFWSLALERVDEIHAVDVIPEALIVLDGFVRAGRVPPCYRDVMAMLGRPADHLAEMRRRMAGYMVFNALGPWPRALDPERFDLVTGFGTVGILPDAASHAACIAEIARHLAPGGRIVGTDWIRSQAFIDRDGHDNRYLDRPALERAADLAGLELLHGTRLPIRGDPLYDHILIWAFAAR